MNLKHAAYRIFSESMNLLGSSEPMRGLRVLTYHSIGTRLPNDPYGTSISETRFLAQLESYMRLSGTFPPTPLAAPETDSPAAAFSFDDGYRDTLKSAAPLLVDRNIPFTVFVPARHIGDSSGLHLTKSELRELASLKNVRIGAHGDRHTPLTRLDDAELLEELEGGRRRLEDLLGKPVDSMSYPYGAVDRRVRDAAKAAGFRTAACSLYGTNTPARDPLLLKRTEIVAFDSPRDFELKLRGHWDWFALRQGDPAA
ncbi:MAG: hypothetical protein AUJ52_12560 [Elusimicrobia bacterium CG1_02_63_36]|nr:MAG: hypothetical protein AUJ52_12560 [Elusimicrobia bacterium CG1_02_63_36]